MRMQIVWIVAMGCMLLGLVACEQAQEKKMQTTTKVTVSPPIPNPIKHEPYVIEDSSRIQQLDGGVLLYVLEQGKGPYPKLENTVIAHYHGMLLDGSVFDSSFDRGSTSAFSLNQVIRGWQIGLTQVRVGSKVKLIIPPEMGYGAQGRPGIPANSTLVFDVQLVSTY